MPRGYFLSTETDADVEEAVEKFGELVRHRQRKGAERDVAIAAESEALGITYWSGWNLLKRRRKSIGSRVLAAIREAYWNYCEQQIARYEAQKARDAKKGCGGDFNDLDSAVASVVARLAEARGRHKRD